MRQLYILLVLLCISTFAKGQSSKVVEDTLFVNGVCDMCKERIEEAAYVKGVKFAEWDKYEKRLKVAYRTDKVALEDIEANIAKAGHQTQSQKADSAAYKELPACCAYKTVHTH